MKTRNKFSGAEEITTLANTVTAQSAPSAVGSFFARLFLHATKRICMFYVSRLRVCWHRVKTEVKAEQIDG